MHRLVIHRLGPIENCDLTCSHFMTFTGFQASGKSTIAKAIYYFRTVKDDIYAVAGERAVQTIQHPNASVEPMSKMLIDILRKKFLRTFGSSLGMDQGMSLEYHYNDECRIKLCLTHDSAGLAANYISITLSDALIEFLEKHDHALTATATGIPEGERQKFQAGLQEFFDDRYHVVYIPAGRSMLTLLSQQLSYIYPKMDDTQRRAMDYCTQDYIERILSVKPEFSDGLAGLMAYYGTRNPPASWMEALNLIQEVLCGSYTVNNGEERIVLENGKYVKINFASSGQQEIVWILNLLFYYLLQDRPMMFIVEEPESHIFPASQKAIMELIALASNQGHSMLITTHSPYVLGTLNNLLYAGSFKASAKKDKVARVISESLWLDYDRFKAWFVKNGGIESCMDDEMRLIQNEKIDGVSETINQDYNDIFELHLED